MKFFTSIAPRHFHEGRQAECIETWLKYGQVFSINNKEECEQLSKIYPNVTFVETTDTHEGRFGKPYVGLNAILACMRAEGGGVLINSDIEITPDEIKWNKILETAKDANKIFYLHRYNYDNEKWRGDIYKDGIDVFFLSPHHLEALPETEYCLGQCYFDIWIPWYLMLKGFKGQTTILPIAFHKNHPAQYKAEHWDYFGQYTGRKFMGSKQRSGEITKRMYRFIRGNELTT